MSVRIKLPPILQQIGGAETYEVTGSTVGECIKNLEAQLPELRHHLFDRQGHLLRVFGIYLNSNGIRPVELGTPVQDNDEIVILNFLTGG